MGIRLGATSLGKNNWEFVVWAPFCHGLTLKLHPSHTVLRSSLVSDGSPTNFPHRQTILIPMESMERGYWRAIAPDLEPGSFYCYQLDSDQLDSDQLDSDQLNSDQLNSHQGGHFDRPDPASHYQPLGVHGPSAIVDHQLFNWSDRDWQPPCFSEWIIYELHVGTFTPEGTFEAIIPRLSVLKSLGITAIELMPVAQFPGDRNWGYDGTYPYAVQQSYGGPDGLKTFVNACHHMGIAVILDVVYNHLGPEGNYLRDFGPYFTDRYQNPWGSALNFDGAYSDEVRYFFLQNALHWLRDYHIDGLRLDAVPTIIDLGAKHFLEALADAVRDFSQSQGRSYYLIAESDLNDVRLLRSKAEGGYGLDAQWSDDFHHGLHSLLTGERQGYYEDFGTGNHLAQAVHQGFVYTGNYSTYRKRCHGNWAGDRPPSQFVVYSQNHDQVGNRMVGERLTQLIPFEGLKLAAATVLLSPFTPQLFMGEEYGEVAPFLYFVDHSDEALIAAVREGRRRDYAAFHAHGEPPDAQSLLTFEQSKLHWHLHTEGHHAVLWTFYQTLIHLRKGLAGLSSGDRPMPHAYSCEAQNCGEQNCEAQNLESQNPELQRLIVVHQWDTHTPILCLLNFEPTPQSFAHCLTRERIPSLYPPHSLIWEKQLDSGDRQWLGPGATLPSCLPCLEGLTELAQTPLIAAPLSFALYTGSRTDKGLAIEHSKTSPLS